MSLTSNASNVLLAKCRAKYGRRLTSQDITAMAGCRTVSEVAAYLKANTHYAQSLEKLDPASARRRAIETALNRELFENFSTLCRYELSVGEWFGDYILMCGEIEQIMAFLCLLAAGRPQEFLFSLPQFFVQHSDINFAELSQCRTYADFLQVMRTSRFIKLLRTFTPLESEPIDCAMIEHALYTQFYDTINGIITGHYSGDARSELLDMIGTQLDIQNFCHIYRLKRYYSADSALVRTMMFGREYRIRPRVMRRIIEAETAEETLNLLVEKTPYGRQFDRSCLDTGGIEAATRGIVCRKATRLLRSSVHPTTVLLSYIILAKNEISDVITIVEGVHYGLQPEAILDLISIDDIS